MKTKAEYEKFIRDKHTEFGWDQPFRVIVDDDIREPDYLLETCDGCGREFTFVVDLDRYYKWQDRQILIQNAMPGIAPEDREILMSHMCGECWKKMFGSENRKREDVPLENRTYVTRTRKLTEFKAPNSDYRQMSLSRYTTKELDYARCLENNHISSEKEKRRLGRLRKGRSMTIWKTSDDGYRKDRMKLRILRTNSAKGKIPMPKVGERVRTPRFLTVMIEDSFDSVREAYRAGYYEPTHNREGYEEGGYRILGKNLGNNMMSFAVARVTKEDI